MIVYVAEMSPHSEPGKAHRHGAVGGQHDPFNMVHSLTI